MSGNGGAHGLVLTLPDLVITLVLGTVLILGEEIGWRGFLLPPCRS